MDNKKLHITITGPAPTPGDEDFVSELLTAVAEDARDDIDGVVYVVTMSGKMMRYTWAAKIEDEEAVSE